MKKIITIVLAALCLAYPVKAQFSKQQIEWNPDGSSLIVVSDNSISNMTETGSAAKAQIFSPEEGEFILDYSAAADAAVIYNGKDSLKVIFTKDSEKTLEIPLKGTVTGAAFNPNGESLLVYYGDTLRTDVFPLTDVAKGVSYEGFSTAAPVYESGWTPDGEHLLWKARGTMQVQNISDGALGPQVQLWDFPQAFTMNKGSSRYAVALADTENPGTVLVILDAQTGFELKRYVLGEVQVSQLVFNQAGDKLFVITRDSLLVINPETGGVLNRTAVAENVSMDEPAPLLSFALAPDESKGVFLLSDGSLNFVYFPELRSR